jgi:hypothetical protein
MRTVVFVLDDDGSENVFSNDEASVDVDCEGYTVAIRVYCAQIILCLSLCSDATAIK